MPRISLNLLSARRSPLDGTLLLYSSNIVPRSFSRNFSLRAQLLQHQCPRRNVNLSRPVFSIGLRPGCKMAPPTTLGKQYMSSGNTPAKTIAEARPSSRYVYPPQPASSLPTNTNKYISILLISPTNEILLLHRVRTSSSFPSAHVFPGGNLSSPQDGEMPPPGSAERHIDGLAYRIGAIRECFEESGILLAKAQGGGLLELEQSVREKGRRDIHAQKIGFLEWVKEQGGVVDTGIYTSPKSTESM